MGKRKERRLAALTKAGRRVKLDLFAEPSGDLGGSSGNEEGGGDIDPAQRSGLPNSPSSSSGQQPQNPLLLLGQYSDDELDEGSNKNPNHTDVENSSSDNDGQGGPPSERKEVDASAVEDLTAQNGEPQDMERDSTPVDVLQSLEGNNSGESDSAVSTDKGKEIELAKQVSVAGTYNAQENGDVGLGWKVVMHEESNQYYYWNTETGETSWELPEALAQMTQSLSHQIVTPAQNMETTHMDTSQCNSTLFVELDSSSAALAESGLAGSTLVSQSHEVHANGLQLNELVEGYQSENGKDKNTATDVCQSELQKNSSVANVVLGDEVTNDELGDGIFLPPNLIKQCESLLERLKSLKGYGHRLQCQDQMSEYILEVDIRLSDIKSLSSCGSSLLPFWIHCQRRLKQLEDVTNNEIYLLAVSAQMDDDDIGTSDAPSSGKKKSCEIVGHDSNLDGCENNRKCTLSHFTITVENGSHNDLPHENVNARHVSSVGLSDEHLEGGAVVREKVNGTAYPEPEFLPGEDVDMDVDMEVDGVSEGVTALEDASSAKVIAPVEQLCQPNTPAEYAALASGDDSTVPPPPQDDWIPPPPPDNDQVPPPPPDNDQIPPPPPDNDQVPPPPPDEPPESSYPPIPSYMETGQPLPYAAQYNLAYPDSNFQYYGSTIAVPSSNLYGHANGSQVVTPHPSLYYEAAANTYAETAPVIVSSVDPVAYYNIQDGSVASVPSVNIPESSHLHAESHLMGYNTLASDQIRTGDEPIEAPRKLKVDVSATASETVAASEGVTSTSIPETSTGANLKTNICEPSSGAVTAVAQTAPKVQSKVSRGKKRTVAVAPSLRSNKKVSSLVDKWKAAKEELNENEEDEPESAYEILEKKKQREIEEWHAKQIASGEAKDNANFQPLGGDWRERVKRRRAQAAKEAAQAPSEAPIVENQQPVLAELSKGLPSGWQAYWDDASKQVYYGNVITSETTWSKPTK